MNASRQPVRRWATLLVNRRNPPPHWGVASFDLSSPTPHRPFFDHERGSSSVWIAPRTQSGVFYHLPTHRNQSKCRLTPACPRPLSCDAKSSKRNKSLRQSIAMETTSTKPSPELRALQWIRGNSEGSKSHERGTLVGLCRSLWIIRNSLGLPHQTLTTSLQLQSRFCPMSGKRL